MVNGQSAPLINLNKVSPFNHKTANHTLTAIPLPWRGGENSEGIFDGVVLSRHILKVNDESASLVNLKFTIHLRSRIDC